MGKKLLKLTKHMKTRYLLIGLLFLFSKTFAQVDPLGAYNRYVVENWSGEYVRIGPYQVKGSPYFFGESLPGNITYKGGKKAADTKILYDVYNQKVGVAQNNEIFEATEAVEEFIISLPAKYGSGKLLFRNSYVYGEAGMKSYLNVLDDGDKISFLKQFKIKLLPDPTNTMAKERKVFDQYSEYYIYSKASKELSKVKLKEKDIMKILGNGEQVKNYLSKNEVDFSKEEEVISLINKYNNNFALLKEN
jgi:hypothetical protein